MDRAGVDARPVWRSPAAAAALTFTLVVVVLAVRADALLADTDTSWHLASAEWMLVEARLPTSDVFSFTRLGEPWIAKEWLSQVVLLVGWRIGGWTGVVTITAVAAAGALAVLAYQLRRRLRAAAVVIAVGVAFVLWAPHLLARPHVLAMPVVVLWTSALVRQVDDDPRHPPWRALPLLVLWANLHASFVLGPLLAIGLGLDAVVRCSAATAAAARRWIAFGVASLAATAITPYGTGSLSAAVDVLGLGPALRVIDEWRPQDLATVDPFDVVVLVAVGAALVTGIRLPWPRTLVLLGLLSLSLSAVRNAGLLGLLGPLLLAAPLAAQRPSLARRPSPAPVDLHDVVRPRRPSQQQPSRVPRDEPATAVLAAAVVAGVVTAAVVIAAVAPRPPPELRPERALAAVRAGGGEHLLHEYAWGGFLIAAGVPTFVDGRTELFGQLVTDHDAALSLDDVGLLDALLGEYLVDTTMLRRSTPAVALLDRSPSWRRLHTDEIAVVHTRVRDAPPGLERPATDGG